MIHRNHPRTIVPNGDDGFVYKSFTQNTVLVQDMSIEGIHFRTDWSSFEDIGWRSLAVNLSDLAAMGAKPHFALVSLAVPSLAEEEHVLSFYRGLLALADKWGVEIAGGDLCRSPGPWIIDINCTGEVDTPMTRNAANSGDHLYVTGTLGLAALGLEELKKGEMSSVAIEKHRRPIPRLDFLPVLKPEFCKGAVDISDGLVNEIGILCRGKLLGFDLIEDKIPLYREANPEALKHALWGGEDYELLLVVSSSQKESFEEKVKAGKLSAFYLGNFTNSSEIILHGSTEGIALKKNQGYHHFNT